MGPGTRPGLAHAEFDRYRTRAMTHDRMGVSHSHRPVPRAERPLADALAALGRRVEELCETDEGLRRQLVEIGRLLVALGSAVAPPVEQEPVAPTSVVEALERSLREAAIPPETAPVSVPPSAMMRPASSEAPPAALTAEDLVLTERRCRLKSEGSRWSAERQRRLAEGADYASEIEPRDREILETARSTPGTFLWMNHPGMSIPEHLWLLEDLGGCYDALAAAIALARDVERETEVDDDRMEAVLDLVAEAQSALRAGIRDVDEVRIDHDQARTHSWLKTVAMERSIFIRRHMRLDDPADPSAWHDLLSRIEVLHAAMVDGRQREARRQSLINRMRYHVKLLREPGGGRLHDWNIVVECVDRLVTDGMPASNAVVRDLLLPVLDELPDEMEDLPTGFKAVLREADRFVASRQAATPQAAIARPPETPEVAVVAQLLAGRKAVLIGGKCRPDARRSLETAFGLEELTWLEAREHQSIASFEPAIARPEVALVMLAIRWSSHSFGDVRVFCDTHGKPLVRLPAGYGVNQVAEQVVRQASMKLRGAQQGL